MQSFAECAHLPAGEVAANLWRTAACIRGDTMDGRDPMLCVQCNPVRSMPKSGVACEFPGHSILLDTVRGELFCTTCKDYIYSPGFDQALQLNHAVVHYVRRGLSSEPGLPRHDPGVKKSRKRRQIMASPAQPPALPPLSLQLPPLPRLQLPDIGCGPPVFFDMLPVLTPLPGLDDGLPSNHSSMQLSPRAGTLAGRPAPESTAPKEEEEEGKTSLVSEQKPLVSELPFLPFPLLPEAAAQPSTYHEMSAPTDGFPRGLRGLNNLGNTCFMNAVLQILFHAPLLRDFFLGQGHTPHTCTRSALDTDRRCLCCEMDSLFSAMYSGERMPYSPVDFLQSWWSFADNLAGYQQQDAHEFYLSALSGMSGATLPTRTELASAGPSSGGLGPPSSDGGFLPGSMVAGCGAPEAAAAESRRVSGSNMAVNMGGSSFSMQWAQDGSAMHGAPASFPLPDDGAPMPTLFGGLMPMTVGQGGPADNSMTDAFQPPMGMSNGPGGSFCFPPWPRPGSPAPGGFGSAAMLLGFGSQGTVHDPAPFINGNSQLDSQPQAADSAAPGGQEGDAQENGDANSSNPKPTSLVDALFSGLLRSDVTCRSCGHTSTAFDPFLDVALDMLPHSNQVVPPGPGQATRTPGAAPSATQLTTDSVAGTAAAGDTPLQAASMPPSQSVSPSPSFMTAPPSPSALSGTDMLGFSMQPQGSWLGGAGLGEREQEHGCSVPAASGDPHAASGLTRQTSMESLCNGLNHSSKGPASATFEPSLLPQPAGRDVPRGGWGRGRGRGRGHRPTPTPTPTPQRPSVLDLGVDAAGCTAASVVEEVTPSPSALHVVVMDVAGTASDELSGLIAAEGLGSVQGGRKRSGVHPQLAPGQHAALQGADAQEQVSGSGCDGEFEEAGSVMVSADLSRPDSDQHHLPLPGLGHGTPAKLVTRPHARSQALTGHLKQGKQQQRQHFGSDDDLDADADRMDCVTSPLSAGKREPEDDAACCWNGEAATHADMQVLQPLQLQPPAYGISRTEPCITPHLTSPQAMTAAHEHAGHVGQGAAGSDAVDTSKPVSPLEGAPHKQSCGPADGDGDGLGTGASSNGMLQPKQEEETTPAQRTELPESSTVPNVKQEQPEASATGLDGSVPLFGVPQANGPLLVPLTGLAPGAGQTAVHSGTGTVPVGDVTLEACLRHLVSPEQLAPKEAWVCGSCKQRQTATKQLSVRCLPPLLCFHVKRFEVHAGGGRLVRKLQTQLHFPLHLDMAPYTTPAILRARYRVRSPSAPPQGSGPMPVGSSWYSLYGVVSHKGDISGGHYIAYVRCGGHWYQMDDAWVLAVDEEQVQACQAFLLFYRNTALGEQ